MVSRRNTLLVVLIVVFSMLGGTAIYYNHYSKMKVFHVLPAENFSSSGLAANLRLPTQISVQTESLKEVGSAWVNLSGSGMVVNGYLLVYYNTTSSTLDYVSIVSQKAMNNFSIPDSEQSQSIVNAIHTLPAYYDSRSEFIVPNSTIGQTEPGNYELFVTGYSTFSLINTPFLASMGGNTSGSASVQFPVIPSQTTPVHLTMHHDIWTSYDRSTANSQQNVTLYLMTGISVPAVSGNNTIDWNISTTFLTDQGIFTDYYNVYNLNYTFTVSVP